MLFFDWEKVKKESRGNPYDVVKIIYYLTYKVIPKNLYDIKGKRYSTTSFAGISFLKNPEKFLDEECKYRIIYSAEYVELASKRNISDYQYYRELRLPIVLADKPIDRLRMNPLLTIDGDYIKFNAEN